MDITINLWCAIVIGALCYVKEEEECMLHAIVNGAPLWVKRDSQWRPLPEQFFSPHAISNGAPS